MEANNASTEASTEYVDLTDEEIDELESLAIEVRALIEDSRSSRVGRAERYELQDKASEKNVELSDLAGCSDNFRLATKMADDIFSR